jgi:hypothetical protein
MNSLICAVQKEEKRKKEKDVNFSCGVVVQDWSRVQRKKIAHMNERSTMSP